MPHPPQTDSPGSLRVRLKPYPSETHIAANTVMGVVQPYVNGIGGDQVVNTTQGSGYFGCCLQSGILDSRISTLRVARHTLRTVSPLTDLVAEVGPETIAGSRLISHKITT